jgi:hypothetical protein
MSLIGIIASSGGKVAKATGGTITFSGGYVYHTFTGNGTFTPTSNITCDVLRIAGGGGASSGGSGAGGLLYSSAQSFTVAGGG